MKNNNVQDTVNQLIDSVKEKTRYQTLINIGYDIKLPDGTTFSEKINEYEKIIQECKTKILSFFEALADYSDLDSDFKAELDKAENVMRKRIEEKSNE